MNARSTLFPVWFLLLGLPTMATPGQPREILEKSSIPCTVTPARDRSRPTLTADADVLRLRPQTTNGTAKPAVKRTGTVAERITLHTITANNNASKRPDFDHSSVR